MSKAQNAQFRPFFEADLLLFQQPDDGRVTAKGLNITARYLEPTSNIGDKVIWVGIVRCVPRTPRLALSLVPNRTYLGRDLPPAADVNPIFPTAGDLEAAA